MRDQEVSTHCWVAMIELHNISTCQLNTRVKKNVLILT